MFDISTLEKIEQYKLLPTHLWSKTCFACGEENPHGLHMKFYTDEKCIFSKLKLQEEKSGWDVIVHGGILSTILDEIMAWAAIYFTNNIILTKTMTVDYKHSVIVNKEIKTVGWVVEQTKKEITLKSQLYNHNNILCAEAVGIYASFSLKVAKKLHLMTDHSFNNFQSFIDTCHNL
ncbi:MAG: PaaI family thioesterase [bacterium]|nr:PaaI family thioesterase [bacterium]